MVFSKAFVVLLAAVLLVNFAEASDEQDCNIACNYIHDPICASDDGDFRYFGNECFIRSHNECYKKSE
jgi:hypothetical protein